MNILLTGGLGHIGSYLMKSINPSVVVDDLSTQRYHSLREFKNTFINCKFQSLTKEYLKQFDVIIHLAAITNAEGSFNNVKEVEQTNYLDTVDLINKLDDQLFIFPSSTSVYGSNLDVMCENSIVNPQSPYANTKFQVEKFLKTSDKNYIIFRLGTIFGTSPGMRFHTAINKFCYQAIINEPLTVWQENRFMKRPYLGLNDASRAFYAAIKNRLPYNHIYNVVSENVVLDDVLRTIMKYKPITINQVNTPLLNQYSYIVSNDKIKEYIILTDKVKDGIRDTFRWFK